MDGSVLSWYCTLACSCTPFSFPKPSSFLALRLRRGFVHLLGTGGIEPPHRRTGAPTCAHPHFTSSSFIYPVSSLGHYSSLSRRPITSHASHLHHEPLPIVYLSPLRQPVYRPACVDVALRPRPSTRSLRWSSQHTRSRSVTPTRTYRAAGISPVLEYFPTRDVSAYLGHCPMYASGCCMHTA